jgi:hypothetical protein
MAKEENQSITLATVLSAKPTNGCYDKLRYPSTVYLVLFATKTYFLVPKKNHSGNCKCNLDEDLNVKGNLFWRRSVR